MVCDVSGPIITYRSVCMSSRALFQGGYGYTYTIAGDRESARDQTDGKLYIYLYVTDAPTASLNVYHTCGIAVKSIVGYFPCGTRVFALTVAAGACLCFQCSSLVYMSLTSRTTALDSGISS